MTINKGDVFRNFSRGTTLALVILLKEGEQLLNKAVYLKLIQVLTSVIDPFKSVLEKLSNVNTVHHLRHGKTVTVATQDNELFNSTHNLVFN